jgi:DNA-binding winged helix-turn-helix (wHTH) protein
VKFLFENHVLDTKLRELRRGSTTVAVEPQVFDLLVHLVRNRDRVVSKDDLIASVWGGRVVSDSTLTSRINAARTAVRRERMPSAGAIHRFICDYGYAAARLHTEADL